MRKGGRRRRASRDLVAEMAETLGMAEVLGMVETLGMAEVLGMVETLEMAETLEMVETLGMAETLGMVEMEEMTSCLPQTTAHGKRLDHQSTLAFTHLEKTGRMPPHQDTVEELFSITLPFHTSAVSISAYSSPS